MRFKVFENRKKSRIRHCERSELRLHFEWTKVNQICQKWSILASFWKAGPCVPTVLLDDKNWWKMPKMNNSTATFWVNLHFVKIQKSALNFCFFFDIFAKLFRTTEFSWHFTCRISYNFGNSSDSFLIHFLPFHARYHLSHAYEKPISRDFLKANWYVAWDVLNI